MPETREEIRGKVVEIVCEQLNVAVDDVKDETHFVNDLGADSLDTVELVMEFEDEFDLDIQDPEAEKITTIDLATRYIFWRLNGEEGPDPLTDAKTAEGAGPLGAPPMFKDGVGT